MMTGGIGALAAARLRRRPGQWLSIGGAVVAAVALVGVLAGLSSASTDAAIRRSVERLDPAERAIQVSTFAPSDTAVAGLDEAARRAISNLDGRIGPVVAGVIFNRARDLHHLDVPDIQVLAADGLDGWTTVRSGRLPAPCTASPCEALLISGGAAADALPTDLTIAGQDLRVVGRGTLTSSLPVGRPDLVADRTLGFDPYDTAPDPPPAYLLVEGTRSAAGLPGLRDVGRSYRWTVPLLPGAVHPWSVPETTDAIAAMGRQLAGTGTDYTVMTPAGTIATEMARGRTAAGRLQLIGSLAVAVLVAFAVFAGVVVRGDVSLETRRLRRIGAGRGRVAVFLALEVLVPVALAAVVGLLVAAAVVAIAASATPGAGASVGPLLAASVVDPGTVGAAVGVAVAAGLGVLAGILVTPRRGIVVGLVPGLVAILVILGWQLLAGEGLGDQLLRGALGGPVLVLLPAVLAFGIAGLFLVAVPAAFRAVARRSGRASLPIRLALLSLAREPARPAATLTLLALSLGALVFAIAYGDTIRRGIEDQAAFETGADLRVAEAGTGLILSQTVVPIDRYAGLGPGVSAWPVLHRGANVEPGGPITLIGLAPEAMRELGGWRSDFSTLDRSELADRIAMTGDFRMPGHALSADARSLGFDVDLTGDPVKLHAVVVAPNGDAAEILLGTVLEGHTRVDVPLPAGLEGGTVIAIRVSDSLLVAGAAHPGSLGRSSIRFRGLDGLVAADTVVDAEVGGVREKVVRAPLPTDGQAIPAIVSPDLAAAADADGDLALPLGGSAIRVHVAGTARRFPAVLGANERFVVTAYDPLRLAIDGIVPGAGHPDEMWIRTADDATSARVASALSRAPFRAATILDRAQIAADRTTDPFAAALVLALLAAAATGLVLAGLGLVLGVGADLRDETGELADLETQGVPTRVLRRLAQARTLLLTTGGVVAGLVVGLALAVLTTSSLALAAGATVAIPELRLVLPWPALIVAALVPVALASFAAAVLSRRGRWAADAPAGRTR
jgi:hypothetical protein